MLLGAALAQFIPLDDLNSPHYTKIVIVFVASTVSVCGLHLLKEIWVTPIYFFYLRSQNYNNDVSKFIYSYGWLLCYTPYVAAVLLFVSFFFSLGENENTIWDDYWIRVSFFIVLLGSFYLTIMHTFLFTHYLPADDLSNFIGMALVMGVIMFVLSMCGGMYSAEASGEDWLWFLMWNAVWCGFCLRLLCILFIILFGYIFA
jgi:hypothetical protein